MTVQPLDFNTDKFKSVKVKIPFTIITQKNLIYKLKL